jgi:predicted nucleic acid-binding protein
VFDHYVTLNISLPDAYIAVEMEQLHDTRVVSFDQNFDKVPGIERSEPS